MRIYTDGSCIGKPDKRFAGYGVCYQDERTQCWIEISAPLLGPTQTNQRSELMAIYVALDEFNKKRSFLPPRCVIVTDSMFVVVWPQAATHHGARRYSINCITKWVQNWRRNGWLTSKGEPVLNRDLIEPAAKLYESLADVVELEWVKGHSGESQGNTRADILATAAAATAAKS